MTTLLTTLAIIMAISLTGLAAALLIRRFNTWRDGKERGTPPDWGE